MTKGEITTVHHFDSKAEVEAYIRGLPILSTFFMAGWYMQNHIAFMPPKLVRTLNYKIRTKANLIMQQNDGTAVFSQTWSPDTVIPMIDIIDTGKFIAPILLDPVKYSGESFTCATAFYTPLQLVEGWTKVTGTEVRYEQTSSGEKHRALTEDMHKQVKKNRGFIDDWGYFGPTGKTDLEWTLAQMAEKPTSWEDFLRNNEPWFPVMN